MDNDNRRRSTPAVEAKDNKISEGKDKIEFNPANLLQLQQGNEQVFFQKGNDNRKIKDQRMFYITKIVKGSMYYLNIDSGIWYGVKDNATGFKSASQARLKGETLSIGQFTVIK